MVKYGPISFMEESREDRTVIQTLRPEAIWRNPHTYGPMTMEKEGFFTRAIG
jgi:hypothetical protein